ncbi:hypothetical protein P3T36_007733 [Kitasatospora sp. MAP12-15]|uniref:DUF4190 domain-containing protein n=1 Tax=unclassified Kitasatospora TaxID=2633591 RepID=UPI002474936A|nr:DUF4190 domain-containing protein [Kitasatospora sp. MAP12-44]MDH6115603.1 hypothetical protein [Kitasatospora sp. MAP12-44]
MTDDRTEQQDIWAPPSPPSPAFSASPWAPPEPGGYGGQLPPGFAEPQWHAGTNGLAIGALVTGLTCCLWPLGLGLGIGALVQLRKRKQRGRGLAVTGIVLGLLGLLVSIAFGGAFVHGFVHGLQHPTAVNGRPSVAWSLKVGDCFDNSPAQPGRIVPVPCKGEHNGEVSARPALGNGAFPGAATAQRETMTACQGSEAAYVTDPWARPVFVMSTFLYPSDEVSWLAGGRTGICYLKDIAVGSYGSPLRRDATNLTPVQQQFLQNLAPLDSTPWAKPTGDPQTDDEAYRTWIQQTSDSISLAKAGLEVQTWPATAQTQVAALLTELRADQLVWTAATRDATTPLDQLVATVSAHSPEAAEAAARTALSLPDHDERSAATQ